MSIEQTCLLWEQISKKHVLFTQTIIIKPFLDHIFWLLKKDIAKPGSYGSGTLFYIETSDLQKAMEVVKKAGGVINSEIKENAWDCKEFLFQDPNGYNFALYQTA